MSALSMKSAASGFNTQTGVVLLLCLIFLTALTLLGLSASADTILQSQLTANLQQAGRAKQSALTGLSWAENWLLELHGPAPENCTEPCDGIYIHTPGELPAHPEFESFSWWTDQGYEAGIDPLSGHRIATINRGGINAPVWIIEAVHTSLPAENGTSDTQVWYRLMARGSDQENTAVSVIESTVVRSWPSIASTELASSERCPGSNSGAKCGRVSWQELR